jgi:superfamily II DNA or RNA helicase
MTTQLSPHQATASRAAVSEFDTADRASVIMPCGTGKTLVGIDIARQLQPRITVLLAPTLALIRQLLESWQSEAPVPGARYIAACSDESIADGAAEEDDIDPGELGAMVTTAAGDLAKFLKASGSDPVVVMTTYVSSSIVGEALALNGQRANLGLFDEAHRTATSEVSSFSAALFDDMVPIDKRLFMTATPRLHPKRESGDGAPWISMDNPALYGRAAYVLPMADAIAQGLITDYRVLVSVVTSDELPDAGADAPGRQRQAAAVAISKAMSTYRLRKGFLFHRTVADAAEFAESAILESETPGVLRDHISGAMLMRERLRRMDAFKAADDGLMANAKCLTEGIDVPAVDLVCFMAPKRSTIDVVQAVGRAIRRAPGKQFGYVLLPVLVNLHNGESLEDAVARAEMSEVVHVLSELRDMAIPYARSSGSGVVSDAAVKETEEYLREKVTVLGSPEVADALRRSVRVMALQDLRSDVERSRHALYLRLSQLAMENGLELVETGWLGRKYKYHFRHVESGAERAWSAQQVMQKGFPKSFLNPLPTNVERFNKLKEIALKAGFALLEIEWLGSQVPHRFRRIESGAESAWPPRQLNIYGFPKDLRTDHDQFNAFEDLCKTLGFEMLEVEWLGSMVRHRMRDLSTGNEVALRVDQVREMGFRKGLLQRPQKSLRTNGDRFNELKEIALKAGFALLEIEWLGVKVPHRFKNLESREEFLWCPDQVMRSGIPKRAQSASSIQKPAAESAADDVGDDSDPKIVRARMRG